MDVASNTNVSLCIVLLCLRVGLLDINGANGKFTLLRVSMCVLTCNRHMQQGGGTPTPIFILS